MCLRTGEWEFFSELNAGLHLHVVHHLCRVMGDSLARESTLAISVLHNSLERDGDIILFSEGLAEEYISLLIADS